MTTTSETVRISRVVLEAVLAFLSAPRNQFGTREAAVAEAGIHRLALAYEVGPCATPAEQAAKVLRRAMEG